MIRISLGNPGSGKTACEVRELLLNKTKRKTYSNIVTKDLPNNHVINPEMIVKREHVGDKKKRDGSLEPVYELKLNKDFWTDIKEPINVVMDEAHSIVNARRAMSKVNQVVTDWMALIRRVLGQSDSGYGELVLISQLHNRIDIIAREMATQIRYHVCHYDKQCKTCGLSWHETSEVPEPLWTCPNCGGKVKKFNHKVEVWCFAKMAAYESWKEFGERTFYKHYLVNDIESVFPLYDTLQWDNMFSELY